MKIDKLYSLKVSSCSSIKKFIKFWARFYNYSENNKYEDNIRVKQFREGNLLELFDWKNGMTLEGSGKKEVALKEKIISKIAIINKFKRSTTLDVKEFNREFENVSAVWRIFLLHIIRPDLYPMYDQHIHRAYNFIHNENWAKVKNTISKKQKLNFYFDTYLPYVKKLKYKNLKELDEAFFAFGQFLNTRKQRKLFWSSPP